MPTETLWVDGLGTERTGWTRIGSSPYLNAQDQPTNYVWTTTKRDEIGDFTFQDSIHTEAINSVTLYVYSQSAAPAGNVDFWIWDGSAWIEYVISLPATWGWTSIVVPVLDSWTKINGAKLYIGQPNSANRTDVDAAYLLVDYAPAVTETITAKSFPMTYLEKPVAAEEIRSKVQGGTVNHVANDFPEVLITNGKAKELRSKWS